MLLDNGHLRHQDVQRSRSRTRALLGTILVSMAVWVGIVTVVWKLFG
jgi:hypothetical protein